MFRQMALGLAAGLPTGLKSKIHNSKSLDNLTRRVYGMALGSKPIEIQEGPMKGIRFAASKHVSHAHIGGSYEQELVDAIDRYLKPGMVCYDIGASIGYLTMQMAQRAKRVYAFEPSPEARGELAKHTAANGFTNIEVVSSPLTDKITEVTFAVTNTAYGSGIDWNGSQEGRWPTIKLMSTTLDLFTKDHPMPDLLKMDIEGEEGSAMEGGRQMLMQKKPIIFCELHGLQPALATCKVLTECGYTVRHMDGTPFDPRLEGQIVPGMLQVIALPSNA